MLRTSRRWRHLLPSIVLAVVLAGCIAGLRDGRDVQGDWPTYGNDPVLGLVATLHTVRAALLGAAAVLLPAFPLCGYVLRRDVKREPRS